MVATLIWWAIALCALFYFSTIEVAAGAQQHYDGYIYVHAITGTYQSKNDTNIYSHSFLFEIQVLR